MKMFGKPEQQKKFEKFSSKLVMFLAILLMCALMLFIGYWFLEMLLWLGETYLIPAVTAVIGYFVGHFWAVILLIVAVLVLAGVVEMSIKDKE